MQILIDLDFGLRILHNFDRMHLGVQNISFGSGDLLQIIGTGLIDRKFRNTVITCGLCASSYYASLIRAVAVAIQLKHSATQRTRSIRLIDYDFCRIELDRVRRTPAQIERSNKVSLTCHRLVIRNRRAVNKIARGLIIFCQRIIIPIGTLEDHLIPVNERGSLLKLVSDILHGNGIVLFGQNANALAVQH